VKRASKKNKRKKENKGRFRKELKFTGKNTAKPENPTTPGQLETLQHNQEKNRQGKACLVKQNLLTEIKRGEATAKRGQKILWGTRWGKERETCCTKGKGTCHGKERKNHERAQPFTKLIQKAREKNSERGRWGYGQRKNFKRRRKTNKGRPVCKKRVKKKRAGNKNSRCKRVEKRERKGKGFRVVGKERGWNY